MWILAQVLTVACTLNLPGLIPLLVTVWAYEFVRKGDGDNSTPTLLVCKPTEDSATSESRTVAISTLSGDEIARVEGIQRDSSHGFNVPQFLADPIT